jgi:hypothetical protein
MICLIDGSKVKNVSIAEHCWLMAQTQCSAHDLAMDPFDAGAITTCARLIHALEKPNLHRLPRSRLSSPSSNN